MKGQDKDSLSNYFMRMWLVSVGCQACGMGILAGTRILGGRSGGEEVAASQHQEGVIKISRKSGMAPPSVERGLTLGLLISPLPPGISLLWAVPWSLHAACPQITYK